MQTRKQKLGKTEYSITRRSKRLPPGYVSNFGRIGIFDGKPVQIISPYSIPPGQPRSNWEKTFTKLKRNGKLSNLPYFLYRLDLTRVSYSQPFIMMKNSSDFTEVTNQSDCIAAVPITVWEKIIGRKKLNRNEERLMDGIKLMNRLAEISIHERKRLIECDKYE